MTTIIANTFILFFNSHFDRDKDLDHGRLRLINLQTQETHIIKASSGYATKQYPECFHERGGMLPPAYRCKEVFTWKVGTKPIPMPNHRGVRGNFYPLTPFEVITDRGGRRSDFGIHLDANAPGSLGCIVTDAKRFALFEGWMQRCRDIGVEQVPLFVGYS